MEFIIPIVVGGIVLAVLLMGFVYSQYYITSPPDIVTILTGRRGFRIVRGGAALRVPVIERIDAMSIAPFELPVTVRSAYSQQGVPINAEATALVRFGSSEQAIKTAVERFLTVDRKLLQQTVQEILTGHMRSIIAKMTVEELNGSREKLVQQVTNEAGADFARIGMELDVLTIKHITDDVGYLDALGRKRTAEVQRDAEIGEAEARRDSMVRSAEARRAGETAQAESDAAIAEAQQLRDVRIAQARGHVETEKAKADQAGPLAQATARREVVEAEVAVEEQRERSNIAVEEQKISREQKSQEAEVVVPARARREAEIALSEGERQAAINRAAGERQRLTEIGQGEADARKAKAAATQTELEAEAAGERAKLLAQAEGREKLADAQNAFAEAGLKLELLPELIRVLPQVVREAAAPFERVGKIVMIDGGSGNGDGPIARFGQTVPMAVGMGVEILRSLGFDLGKLVGQELDDDAPGNGTGAGNGADPPAQPRVRMRRQAAAQLPEESPEEPPDAPTSA
jgi:flotillin